MKGNDIEEEMKMEESKRRMVYMCGYLPGASPDKSPLLSPVAVRLPEGDSWKDVCGGGCGFAMAISESGKLITWGSTDEEGQSYLTAGKHGETPEPFVLPTEASVVTASAGWAHCVSVTEIDELYTWGWKECVPSGKKLADLAFASGLPKDIMPKQSNLVNEQASLKSQSSSANSGTSTQTSDKKAGEETGKRRKLSSAKPEVEGLASGDETFIPAPCLVNLGHGVRISSVAAGGRHTLALSDVGQVWGWGYGGEGQLGLGSRIKIVSSPHLIPCVQPPTMSKDLAASGTQGTTNSVAQVSKSLGTFVRRIACGGRHSVVLTDAGALLTFGWGLYGQCGQGTTTDQLRPTCVSSFLGTTIEGIAAGLWHTLCVSSDGNVYSFGGNQFGQLGTGAEHAETLPRLLDCSGLKNKSVRAVSAGARHSAVLTEDGQVFSWGWNKYGQLGLGDSMDRNIPSQIPLDGCSPVNIACGWWHSLMLAEVGI